MHKEALASIGRIGIGCFFLFHVFVFGVGGISNTLEARFTQPLREHVYYKVNWYTQLLDQDMQNWGFFGFVPNAIVRYTFEVEEGNTRTEIQEYKLTDWPYIGRQTEFNLLRGISVKKEEHAEPRERYLDAYCKQHNLAGKKVVFSKKYAYLPKEEDMHQFNWNAWQPDWRYYSMNTITCT